MTKRLIIILLIASLSAVIFTACSRDNSNSETTVNEEEITTAKKDKDTTVEPTTKKHVEKETTTEPVEYAVDSNGKIVFPDEKVTKIQIRDGNTGEDYLITTEEEINKFIDELKAIKFSAIEADQTSGTSYMLALANDKNETLVGLIVQGPRTTFTYETKGTIYVHDKDLVKICEKYVK